MQDSSYLDTKYFIDETVFNCPFCNRRNVNYLLCNPLSFNWTREKQCFIYRVVCNSCENVSMHLSYEDIKHRRLHSTQIRFILDEGEDLDMKFFYSVPTSFFTLDKRIPTTLRELMTEAEGCLKSNFLTGASACARKLVYELAVLEGAEGDDYEGRLKSLKKKRPDVEPEYFDTLVTIQQVTSEKVHETSYDGWQSHHLRAILSTLRETLTAMYVVPKVKEEKRAFILSLKEELKEPQKKKAPDFLLARGNVQKA